MYNNNELYFPKNIKELNKVLKIRIISLKCILLKSLTNYFKRLKNI